MTTFDLRANINSLILFAVLVLNAFYQSKIGGPGSIFNIVGFLFVLLFILLNARVELSLLFFFALPLLFLGLSMFVNLQTLDMGGVRSALATAAGYALFTLKPVLLNRQLLRKMVFYFLFISLVLSLYFTKEYFELTMVAGNDNFNGNPNSASIYFFLCLILSLIMVEGRSKWIFVASFAILILSTGSRTGLVAAIMLYAGYLFFCNQERFSFKDMFLGRNLYFALAFVVVPILVFYFFPDYFEYLSSRISDTGFDIRSSSPGGTGGRDDIWRSALDLSQNSLTSLMFGYGPTSASEMIGIGTHSSYVEAITSEGWPFLIFTLIALAFLFRYHIARGSKEILVYAIPILAYGTMETILFNGLSTIWYVLMLLSLYYRSEGYVFSHR